MYGSKNSSKHEGELENQSRGVREGGANTFIA